MQRHHEITLANWLQNPNRKPLVIRGARQVGKSTLVRLFADASEKALAEVNLERFPQLAETVDTQNPASIINVLEALPNATAIDDDCLLFLDEIQAIPSAIKSLRYFYEDMPNQPILAAGSLLEFALGDAAQSMPVGRIEYLHMGPMTFTEFLHALGEQKLLSIIQQYQLGDAIPLFIHERLLTLTREFFFVGGMPEAVKSYAENRKMLTVASIHRAIIDTYRDDFPKYIGRRNPTRIQHVFNYAARNVGNKVKYQQFSREDTSATIKTDIELLSMARVLHKVIRSHGNGLPLQAELDERHYKLVFLDVGLMNALCGNDWRVFSAEKELTRVNEGAIAEQFIGQHLLELLAGTANRQLTYWQREGKSNNAEVDYLMGFNGKVVPIEVKAGAAGRLRSLHQFMALKNASMAIRFDSNPPSSQEVDTTIKTSSGNAEVRYLLHSLPLYLVERLPMLLGR